MDGRHAETPSKLPPGKPHVFNPNFGNPSLHQKSSRRTERLFLSILLFEAHKESRIALSTTELSICRCTPQLHKCPLPFPLNR